MSQRLAEVIARLKGTGLSVLIAESDLKHVARLVQRTYVIERGETALSPDARGQTGGGS